MSYNGSGTFVINTAGQPVVANTVISATVFNALTADLATGLSTAITKDGQTTITANIPFGSNKITGLGAATAATDAATLGQVQSTAAKLITVTGTDTITGTMSPALTAYAAGQLFYFIANAANTGAMTINIDGLGAKAITRDGSTALIAGDVNTGEIVVICYDGTRFQMINAANSFGNTTINGTLTVTGNTGLQANVSITSTLSVGGTFAVTGAATLGSTLSVTGKSDLPVVSTASMNAAVAVITTGTVTNLTSTSASIASMNAGVALLTNATVTTLTATGASIASANIGNLQFTAASIASINAGVAVITNLTATSASIASMNAGVALLTTATVTNLTATGASIASANAGNLQATGASVASANVGVALITTGTVTALTATGASIASANVGTAVVTGLTVTNASIASANAGTATLSGNLTLSAGTANGVLYLNGSKVATSGSGLTYNGSTFVSTGNVKVGSGAASNSAPLMINTANGTAANIQLFQDSQESWTMGIPASSTALTWANSGTEQMRLTSTGLGIGTSSPTRKLDVSGSSPVRINTTADNQILLAVSGTAYGQIFSNSNTAFGITDGGATGTLLNLTQAGNLGLGVSPSAWGSIFKAAQIGTGGSIFGRDSGNQDVCQVGANVFWDGSNWKYIASLAATRYEQASGTHAWHIAASGTAGNTISFTQALTLDASGQLALGTSTASTTLGRNITINGANAGTNTGILLQSAGTERGYLYGSDSQVVFGSSTSIPAVFVTGGSERARITSGGDFLVNATSSNGRFCVETSSAQTTAFFGDLNASTTQNVISAYTSRAADSAFNFLKALSNGGSDTEFLLRGDGNGYADGTWNNNGADYAEFFESATGAALTVGATVVLDGNKVREATASDPVSSIIGVVRPKEPGKASMMVGNTAWNKWANKYLTDDFDRYIMEDHDVVEWTDADGKQHSYESHNIPTDVTVPSDAVVKTHDDKGNKFQHYKINPAYNRDSEYTPREKRDEWIIVGLVGQVKVLKGKPVNDRWIKMRDVSAAVEEWMIR